MVKEERGKKIIATEPPVHLCYASGVSNLKGAGQTNVIFHNFRKKVKYFSQYTAASGTRICIVSENFDFGPRKGIAEKQFKEGWCYIVSDVLQLGSDGIYLLVYPEWIPDGRVLTASAQQTQRRWNSNLDAIDAYLPEGNDEQLWKAGCFLPKIGEENKGIITVNPPSKEVDFMVEDNTNFTPVPGTLDYINLHKKGLFGEIANNTEHPAFKRMVGMT